MGKKCQMDIEDIMTILVFYHISRYDCFKSFYKKLTTGCYKHEFKYVSYNRFIEIMGRAFVPLYHFLQSRLSKECKLCFIDSTPLKVCHFKRAKQHKVFKGLASTTKATLGWIHGFKLHIIINFKGELVNFKLTKANVDDRKCLMDLTKNMQGILVGDKGYISEKNSEKLKEKGVTLVTKFRKNMKHFIVNKRVLRIARFSKGY